jgi:hypothetical protein
MLILYVFVGAASNRAVLRYVSAPCRVAHNWMRLRTNRTLD